jgi:uncharacterized protein
VTGAHVVRVWSKEDPFLGAELADVTVGNGGLSARGSAIGTNPFPYRLRFELTTVDQFVTSVLGVRTEGKDWSRRLELRRAPDGSWSFEAESEGAADLPAPGGDVEPLAGALDCDLGLSPLTNSMPILRHGLHEDGGPVDFLMAWVSVPDLAVHPSRQRYTFLRRESEARIVRYESRGGNFVADLRVDADGLVMDYPKLARRIG